uniref:ABC transporter domain-containing protein n=1 Tax=Bursaphelenchus xylophilus TaxID=6326 RepID=A0A1I7S566_BURXY
MADVQVENRLVDFMQKAIPTIAEEVAEYLSKLLVENAAEITTADEVFEQVSDSLMSWEPDTKEDDVRELCEKFLIILHNGKKVEKQVREFGAKKLEKTVDMSETTSKLHNIDSIWNIQAKDVPTMGGVVLVSHDERLIDLVCKELWVVKDRTVTRLDGGLEEYKKHVYRQLAIPM